MNNRTSTDRNRSTALTPLNQLIDQTHTPTPAQRRARTMEAAHDASRCSYVTPVGTRCGSPAMRNNLLCYYHDRYKPKRGYRNLPPLEDACSIQCAIQEIIEDLLAGLIDYKRAALVLYGLQTAASNLKHMRLIAPSEVVTEIEEDAVESPRPPQNVRVGLTQAERAEMRNWFPAPILKRTPAPSRPVLARPGQETHAADSDAAEPAASGSLASVS